MTYQDYLKRFADLIVELDDEEAARVVLSIENDPRAVVELVTSIMYSTVDAMEENMYAIYAMGELSYASLEIAMQYFRRHYTEYKLPVIEASTLIINPANEGYDY